MSRRRRIARTAVVVAMLATATLSGCASLKLGGAGGEKPSAPRPAIKVVEPDPGSSSLGALVPVTAASFSAGPVAVGDVAAGKGTLPALSFPGGPNGWTVDPIGSASRNAYDAAELGAVQVVVGAEAATGPPGSPQVPFIAVSEDGAPWSISVVGASVFGGSSAELQAVGSTGNVLDPSSLFMAVGGTVRSPTGELGSPSGTIPVALTSSDGKTWTRAAALPLPEGVEGGIATDITYSPSRTAHPGTLVVGFGWAEDKVVGRREVGLVWHTADEGKTWELLSDDNFDEAGRSMSVGFIAADDQTIVAAGSGDVPGQKGGSDVTRQSESMDWTMGMDGEWHIISDGASLRPERSSMTTALIARKDAGFLTANEFYDTDKGATLRGSEVQGSPAIAVFSSLDGRTWNDVSEAFPGIGDASIITGLTEFAHGDTAYGMLATRTVDAPGGTAWVAARQAVK